MGSVPFAVFQVAVTGGYPPGYALWAWTTTGVLAAGAAVCFWLSGQRFTLRQQSALSAAALAFDCGIVFSYVLAYNFQEGTPVRQLLFLPIVESALRYGMAAPLLLSVATVPVLVSFEALRSDRLPNYSFRTEYVTFQVGIEILTALIVGWLVRRLADETRVAEERAQEAEQLRDTLGRRVDLLDAANRCARALNSSLEMEQAFKAFIRELRGLVGFDRASIALHEEGRTQIMATAGVGAKTVYRAGAALPPGSLLEEVMNTGRTVYRDQMSDRRYPEERELYELGLRSRVVAPLHVGARPVGVLALVRRSPASFTQEEIELLTLLGRLVATAVQNIRAYEAERRTVEELRRLSALRADFVSLVSHELRSPMAAVIGAARTLEQRWRELGPEQRSSFLALIADETSRLATLIGDVLDTSRIEAGTFSYSFGEVDIGELVLESAAAARLGQDEVRVEAELGHALPRVRGDRERLRQVLANLIDNAVKYSPAGGTVTVTASADDGAVLLDVNDEGPGIAREHQKVIFEKFGRLHVGGGGKPGSGLGLFIARSIAEAHGGRLTVRSAPARGATFHVELPL